MNLDPNWKEETHIPYFRGMVIQNFPFIEKDFDSITDYQLLCKVVEYLNKVINQQNIVEDNVSELLRVYEELKNYVEHYFDNLDIQTEINNKLDEMASDGTLENLINIEILNNITDDFILFTFFDENDNNKINLFTSKDGVNLTKLNIDTGIYGRDPSITKINDTFYIATTDYSTTYDFALYTSKNLITWTKHEIDLGLYNSEYPKRWAPDLYVENNELYVLISKQYANTERSGNFKNYIAKCNDLEELTFDTPTEIILTGTTSTNYIDCNLIKIGNIYHLTIKNETTGAIRIEHFTSLDMINYQLVNDNFGDFGDYREGCFVIKYGNDYYLYAERYGYNVGKYSVYAVKKSKDLNTFSNIEIMESDIDISHGGAIVINDSSTKNLIQKLDKFVSKYNDYFSFREQTYLNAFETVKSGVSRGNFLKIMSIKPNRSYKNISIIFNISDVQNARRINSLCSLFIRTGNANALSNDNFYLKEISGLQYGATIDPNLSLFNKLAVYLNTTDGTYDLVLDLQNWDSDMTIMTSIISIINANASDITVYEDTFFNDRPANLETGARFVGKCWSDAPFTKNLFIDIGNHTSLTINFVSRNGIIKIKGHDNDLTKLIDSYITILNGDLDVINKENTELSVSDVTYSDTTQIYSCTITGFAKYAPLILELMNEPYNSFISYELN